MEKTYYVYLLTNWNNQVMYVGVTNNLERRIYEHRNKLVDGFTKNITLRSWFTSRLQAMCWRLLNGKNRSKNGGVRRRISW